jgi:dephospho-CoA kinase
MSGSETKIVIGLVGEMGSGKGTSAAYLKERHGASSVRFSNMLRDILGRLYLPDIRENLQTLSAVLRRTFGEDVMARVVAEDARRAGTALVVADGVRRPDDLVYLKKAGAFFLVALEVEARTREPRRQDEDAGRVRGARERGAGAKDTRAYGAGGFPRG